MRRCLALRSRFVPPWELDGTTPETFFGEIMQSAHPGIRARRDKQRAEAALDQAEADDAMMTEAMRPQSDASAAFHDAAVQQQEEQRNFLPYGAEPRRFFDSSKLAAWGEYVQGLQGPGGYSPETQALLQQDMDTLIPYKYAAVPHAAAGGALQWPLHGTAVVVLDIDGVVYRSKQIIKGSDEAVRQLHHLKIPFCFMTNGGGYTEQQRAEQLSLLLGCPIQADQVIMSHSPLKLLAPRYKGQGVLIVGPEHCAHVAQQYGFDRAISSEAFMRAHPELVPQRSWAPGTAGLAPRHSVPYPEIAAVLQFTDPVHAFHDTQIILDILTSPNGRIGSYVSGQQTVPFYNSADDLLWATDAPLPRLGQGAFREMLASVYESVTGQSMQVIQLGKPRAVAYAYAEGRLAAIATRLGWKTADMQHIFMVGDNLETDIVGANARGGRWVSVHVLSGVGRAPSARRTLPPNDAEVVWLEEHVSKTPHYVAPTLDHFVRELLAFKPEHLLSNRTPFYGPPCPVDLEDVYGLGRE